jgi:NTE family protein
LAFDSLHAEPADPRTPRSAPTNLLVAAAMAVIVLLSGCASTMAPHNAPFAGEIAARGYRVGDSRPLGTPESLVFGLSFSGGGTRAAALAYGVLEELSRTQVMVNGEQRRMLDLVETISAVSGGSYTAAYYGLFGDRIFKDFEPRFLKRNVQNEMATTLFSPANLFNMSSPYYGRSDVTAEYLDQILFEGKTFADLDSAVRQYGRPFVLINATDMARTSRFEFTQDQFDLLCSDIGSYKVSRAVAASSAIPVIFSPITLANYAGQCGFSAPQWMTRALRDRHDYVRRYAIASDLTTYLDADKRKYVHLLDGGLSDNLGLRAMLDRLTLLGPLELADHFRRQNLRRLVRIVVNAQARHEYPQLDQYAEVPTLSAIAFAVGNTTERYTVETLAYARSSMNAAAKALAEQQHDRGQPDGDDVQAMLIEVSFDDLESEAERAYFNALPTSFTLPAEDIDRLREAGGRLLRNSPDYQRLLRELPTLR